MPKTKTGQIRVSLPEGFDTGRVLSDAGLDQKWTTHVEFMVGDVCNWRKFYRREQDEYQPYAVQNFRAGVPKDEVAKLTKAIVPSVLEAKKDGRYRFGTGDRGECREYRLAAEYRDRPLVNHVIESYSIWNRLHAAETDRQKVEEKRVAELPEVYRRLCEMEKECQLTGEGCESDEPIVPYLTQGEGSRPRWFNVCDFGRAHHATSVCPRWLRQSLAFTGSGQSLSIGDVSGSQILLAALTVMGLMESEPTGEERGKREERRRQGLLSGRSSSGFTEGSKIIGELLTGEFGPKLEAAVAEDLERDGRKPYTAEAVKVGRMSALFGRWDALHTKTVGRTMLRLYPNFMSDWADVVKRMPHGELARRMQRVESDIMIHGAAARILRERPALRFVTIHDAILCDQRHIGYVREVIRGEWEAKVGLAPMVKMQQLSRPCAA